jgi:DNA repair exonuclease SbcCD nuclease subunit
MIKKIVHLADIHIRTNQLHDLYKEQFTKFLEDLRIRLFLEGNQDVTDYYMKDSASDEVRIVITGDLFHQKINISNEQILLSSWFLTELSKIAKVIIIPGNHDFLENNMERVDSITPVVGLLNNPNIIFYKDGGVYEDDNIKWVVYSLYQHNERPKFKKDNDYYYIGLFHDPIQGMSTDLGYSFDDAYDKINFNECDLVLCGDIHKRSVLYLEKEIEVDENDKEKYIKDGWEISV